MRVTTILATLAVCTLALAQCCTGSGTLPQPPAPRPQPTLGEGLDVGVKYTHTRYQDAQIQLEENSAAVVQV